MKTSFSVQCHPCYTAISSVKCLHNHRKLVVDVGFKHSLPQSNKIMTDILLFFYPGSKRTTAYIIWTQTKPQHD